MKATTAQDLELSEVARANWPAELVAMLDVAVNALAKDTPEDEAERVATRMLAAIANYYGGRMFYLPKGDGLERALRDREIYRQYEHQRGSVLQLAEKYRMTEQHIYSILAKQRALHAKRIKPVKVTP